MAPVVHTPVEGFTGTVVGVTFRDGAGETDDPAALGYFQSAGYRIDDEAASAVPLTDEEAARVAAQASTPDAESNPAPATPVATEPEAPAPPVTPEPQAPATGPKRPYPQANKGEWFEYLSAVKPGHGLTPDNTKAEIIAAVDAE